MLKRGYIILLVGAALVIIGISLTAAYRIGIASVILNESIILSDVSVDSSSSVNRTLDIINTERPVSIALHVETNANSDNSVVEQTIINPEGFVINKNEFGARMNSFQPEIEGIYTLSLHNLGTEQVKIGGIFGYLPITENSGEINLSTIAGLLAGAWVFVIGIGTLVGGTVITVLDRRRDKTKQSLGFQ
ncbi:MAG: hypothetical protein WA941_09055 [Nitrososphaeraceae archaeon]